MIFEAFVSDIGPKMIEIIIPKLNQDLVRTLLLYFLFRERNIVILRINKDGIYLLMRRSKFS
jgi:hypothetical protein